MNLYTIDDKLFELITSSHNLLPVLNRFGLRPGFKDKSVAEICKEKDINENFFLVLVNTYNNPEYFPEEELLGFSPVLIVKYLKETHNYYLNYFLPKIEMLLKKLIEESPEGKSDMKMIISFYEKYRDDLLLHIKDEEENIFPKVLSFIENKANTNNINGNPWS